MQITYTQHAYIDPKHYTLESVKKGDYKPHLSCSEPGSDSYFEKEGYAHIGTATVTLEIKTDDEIVSGQIQALNVQLQSVRAECQQKENAILLQISKLQSLTMA